MKYKLKIAYVSSMRYSACDDERLKTFNIMKFNNGNVRATLTAGAKTVQSTIIQSLNSFGGYITLY